MEIGKTEFLAKRHGSRKQHDSSLVSLSSFRFHFRNTFPCHVNTRPTEWLIIGGFGLAANNAAPLQPLPEFHTTVSSVNFECTRALSRKRTPAPIESARPRGRRDEDLGISSCVPRKRTTFLVVRQIRSNLSIESASPPPFSLLLFLPHIFVIFGSPMFTHLTPLLFGTTCNRFPCATLVVPLISTRFSLEKDPFLDSKSRPRPPPPEEEG